MAYSVIPKKALTRTVCMKVTEVVQDSKSRIRIVPPQSTYQLWLVVANSSPGHLPDASKDVDGWPSVRTGYSLAVSDISSRRV